MSMSTQPRLGDLSDTTNAGALALLVALSLGARAIGLVQPVPVAAGRR